MKNSRRDNKPRLTYAPIVIDYRTSRDNKAKTNLGNCNSSTIYTFFPFLHSLMFFARKCHHDHW